MTATEIRNRYPNPISIVNVNRLDQYCVGGALCLYLGEGRGFPNEEVITTKLRIVNPKIPEKDAREIAVEIIRNNECGNFDTSWQLLDKALSYKKE
jgi:hypothetical protein